MHSGTHAGVANSAEARRPNTRVQLPLSSKTNKKTPKTKHNPHAVCALYTPGLGNPVLQGRYPFRVF